jgi:parallel beta-helix repeat protein
VDTTGGNVRVNLPNVNYPIDVIKTSSDSYIVTVWVGGVQKATVAGELSKITIDNAEVTADEPWYPYDAIVGIAGVSGDGGEILAKDRYGRVIAGGRGVAGTDDRTIIHAAQTYIVAGQLMLSSQFVISNPIHPATNVHIKGINNAKLTLKNAVNDHVIEFDNVSNSSVRDLEIDGNKANQTTDNIRCIQVNGGSNIVIERNICHDSYADGICLDRYTVPSYIAPVNVHVIGNTCYNAGNDGIKLHRANKCIVERNMVYDNDNHGIHFYSDVSDSIAVHNQVSGSPASGCMRMGTGGGLFEWAPSHDNYFIENILHCSGPSAIGIQVGVSAHDCIFRGNKIFLESDDAGATGIYIMDDVGGYGFPHQYPYKNSFIENEIYAIYADGVHAQIGIRAAPSSLNSFIGNKIVGNNKMQIGMSIDGRQNTIIRNTVSGTQYGIYLTNVLTVCDQNNISNNRVERCSLSGIRLAKTTENHVSHNTILNCAKSIWLSGAGGPWTYIYIEDNVVAALNSVTTITVNVSPADINIPVDDPSLFMIGDTINIYDSITPAGENAIIESITNDYTGKVITITAGLAGTYTTANSAGLKIVNNIDYNLRFENSVDYVFVRRNKFSDAISNVLSDASAYSHKYFAENDGYPTDATGSSTGTGSEQAIPHGLAAIPTGCKAWIKIEYPVGSGRYITKDIPYDVTYVYPTVDNGVAFEWGIA